MSKIVDLSADALGWVDERLPVVKAFKTHMSEYYAPKNFNFWYYFGVLAMVALAIQIMSGIWLMMFYTPSIESAFDSIEYIMRDVEGGWFIRYMHEVGATFFFLVIYLHIFRALLYGSYQRPRELVWIMGMVIYIALMAEGFFGYVLPWGNMSFWAAKVIISLVGAVPYVGESIQVWVQGDFMISDSILHKFFAFHVMLVPLIVIVVVFIHLIALHQVGSNNPDGVDIKAKKDAEGIPLDGIPFHPYYTVHDLVPIVIFMMLFFAAIFFFPDGGGYFLETPNFVEANILNTPEHITPAWYYTPFYAMLRGVTIDFFGVSAKFWGLVVMGGSMMILIFLPWLDRSPVKSLRYKGMASKTMLGLFAFSTVALGVLGVKPADWAPYWVTPVLTITYFSYFLFMPIYTSLEATKTVPERVTMGAGH